MNIFLEIFLFFDVFIIGVVFAIAMRHAYAHKHPEIQAKPQPSPNPSNTLAPEERDKLKAEAEAKYRRIVENSTEQLAKELGITAEKINQAISKISSDILKREQEGFDQLVKHYEDEATNQLNGAKLDTEKYKAELKAQVEKEIGDEKQRRLQQIENQMADIVMSFLTEALQHEVDLGSQTDYLIKLLEKHKQEFKRAIRE